MNITHNRSSQEQIEHFFYDCSNQFNPPFASSVDITEYAKKIRDNALTIETWDNDELVAIIAAYVNGDKLYIPYICTKYKCAGLGLGQAGFDYLMKTINDCKEVELEVRKNNVKAINFYHKLGFEVSTENNDKYKMTLKVDKKPLVSISCIVYNHAPYLRECFDGFVMQQTDFAFEVLVHDDASTDNSADIIREYTAKYPDIFKPLYQTENQYSQGIPISATYQFPRARGKYIALCEGDDYWTDPLKLQKQVDFLEANPDYGMCYTQVQIYHHETNKFGKTFGGPNTEYIEILKENTTPTLTVVANKNLILEYIAEIKPETQNWEMGDYPIWLWFAHTSKIKFINAITGVYRILQKSATHSPNIKKREEFIRSISDMKLFFAERYGGLTLGDIKDLENTKLMSNAMMYEEYKDALKYYRLVSHKSIKTRIKAIICHIFNIIK